MRHPNLVHVDDVPLETIDRGPLQGRRQRLGAAAGLRRAGLSRYVLGPGEMAMPPHAHADEEEHAYVLAGSGLSWQAGRVWEVRAGDVVVHPAGGDAHTMVAGDEGLDVLIFATGSPTGMTYLPRTGSWWMGPRWLPSTAEPVRARGAGRPLELPAPETSPARSSPAATRWRPARPTGPGTASAGGSSPTPRAAAMRARRGRPRARLPALPPHWHGHEEECFYVLEGEGDALIDDEAIPVRPGSVLACPPAGIAHSLRAGRDGLTYIAWGTRVPGDYAFFPRSRKLSFARGVILRVEEVDYFEGEDLP